MAAPPRRPYRWSWILGILLLFLLSLGRGEAAGPQNRWRHVGTFFFYWHDCPERNCDPSSVPTLAPGWTEPLVDDPDPTDGVYYSSLNLEWYVRELLDMRRAGVEWVFPVSWGDYPAPWFRTEVLTRLVEANRRLGVPLKIGLFDDSTSEASEYNDRADDGAVNASRYESLDPLPLSDPISGYYVYDLKIKPFFRLVPREMWATIQGRPVIVVYVANFYTDLHLAGELWRSVKEAFRRDFGVEPWLILEDSWFVLGGPDVADVADGRYHWGAALEGPVAREHRGFRVVSVGPGFDDRYVRPETPHFRARDVALDGTPGGPAAFLESGLEAAPPADLLLIETWNELWEGTSVARAYYRDPRSGRRLPEDFYIDVLSRILRGRPLTREGVLVETHPRAPFQVGRLLEMDLSWENQGEATWEPARGTRLQVDAVWLETPLQIDLDRPILPGGRWRMTLVLPPPSRPGTYNLTLQLMDDRGAFGPTVSVALVVHPAEYRLYLPSIQTPRPTVPRLPPRRPWWWGPLRWVFGWFVE